MLIFSLTETNGYTILGINPPNILLPDVILIYKAGCIDTKPPILATYPKSSFFLSQGELSASYDFSQEDFTIILTWEVLMT
jgi:hypothetical protein